MPITADHIRVTVTAYLDEYPQDKGPLSDILELLEADADITSRKEFRGHVTAGAVLVNDDGDALFIHHVALGKWLTPGGHVEPEDASLVDAARRELVEETGISPEGITLAADTPVHIDVHPIPANPANGEGDHQHFDFRFLFRTAGPGTVTLQEEEVSASAWRPIETLSDATLKARVLDSLN